jgi:phage shock protein E
MSPFQDGAVLLDVRSPEETAAGRVRGALLIPIDELPGRVREVRVAAGGLNRPILVMCKLGRRAEKAVQILRAAGFTRAQNIGGIDVEPLRSLLGGLTGAAAAQHRKAWAPRG